jgi:hypothetical protein
MPAPEASANFYRHLQRLQVVLVAAGRRAWGRMDPADFDRSWRALTPDLLLVVTASQLAAARAATDYVPAVLAETDQPDEPAGRVRPMSFAGVAADGRPLTGLLQSAVVRAKGATQTRVVTEDVDLGELGVVERTRTLQGLSPEAALALGGRWLDMLLQTTVSDAARNATTAEIVVRDRMGWVRMINPPCCGRCAILAGRWYRWSSGFQRHPRCDCVHIPSLEDRADDFRTDPKRVFDEGLVTGLTRREQQRLADGADPATVINESRDMWRARIQDQKRQARAAEQAAAAATPAGRAQAERVQQSMEGLLASAGNRGQAEAFMRQLGWIT